MKEMYFRQYSKIGGPFQRNKQEQDARLEDNKKKQEEALEKQKTQTQEMKEDNNRA